jgi:hypothetical protein
MRLPFCVIDKKLTFATHHTPCTGHAPRVLLYARPRGTRQPRLAIASALATSHHHDPPGTTTCGVRTGATMHRGDACSSSSSSLAEPAARSIAACGRLQKLGSHLTAAGPGPAAPAPVARRAHAATSPGQPRPRLALVTTVWFAGKPPTDDDSGGQQQQPGTHGTPSHSVHMGDRFLTGGASALLARRCEPASVTGIRPPSCRH